MISPVPVEHTPMDIECMPVYFYMNTPVFGSLEVVGGEVRRVEENGYLVRLLGG